MKETNGIQCDKKIVRLVTMSLLVLGIIAHAYIFFEFYPSHDSLTIVTNDWQWQISLGRFAQPLYILIRKTINVPWLIGILSFIFLGLSLLLIFDLLGVKNSTTIIILCGLFVTNIIMVNVYATYMSWADIYMLALLCSCSGVYLLNKSPQYLLLSMLLLAFSMGLYQSYVSCAIALMILHILKLALNGINFGQLCKMAFKYIICLIGSAILYLAFVKTSLYIFDISLSKGYNGLAGLLQTNIKALLTIIPDAYKHVFSFFKLLTGYNTMTLRICNLSILILSILAWRIYLKKTPIPFWNKLVIGIAILVFPIGMNFAFIMAMGWAHLLMTFSFNFIYLLLFIPHEHILQEKRGGGERTYLLTILLCCFILFHNITYSNGAYYYKNIIGRKTDFYMTSLINEINHTPEYISGETPVIIVGDFDKSYIAKEHAGFEKYNDLLGASSSSITYLGTFSNYCSTVLGNPINLVVSEDEIKQVSQLPEVIDMPAFPTSGFCKIIDDIMIVKLQ